jgi:predicted dehydrogenase
VRGAHLPAYKKHGFEVAGVFDPSVEAVAIAQTEFGVRAYAGLEDLLGDPTIEVVDVATHAAIRPALVRQALDAGKHVLSQKPLAPSIEEAEGLVRHARDRGLCLAVNQNGRWSPPWRLAQEQIDAGAIGEVSAVTHLFEAQFGFVPNSPFDRIPHWLIYDYAIHWIDITRCWMGERRPLAARAREFRPPNQQQGDQPWSGWIEIEYEGGANAMIRSIGGAATTRLGHPFWVHGTSGVLRGSVLGGDFLELDAGGETRTFDLQGSWFPDGFAGTVGELYRAIESGREPWNSARHNLLSLRLTLAACESAGKNGEVVPIA